MYYLSEISVVTEILQIIAQFYYFNSKTIEQFYKRFLQDTGTLLKINI